MFIYKGENELFFLVKMLWNADIYWINDTLSTGKELSMETGELRQYRRIGTKIE